jgi:hypothetical protein
MRKDLLPKFLQNLDIRGSQDDDENEDDESSDSESDEGDEEQDSDKAEDTTALKNALRKERNARKKFERDFKKLQKTLGDKADQEKSETDKAKEDASKAESKAQKLAERLKLSAVDNAIIKVGTKMKFRDIDDALKLIDRDAIDIEQDEDDPTVMDLDETSVKAALDALAKAKPHLILADGQGEASGSKFGGSRKSNESNSDKLLMERYEAFGTRERVPSS